MMVINAFEEKHIVDLKNSIDRYSIVYLLELKEYLYNKYRKKMVEIQMDAHAQTENEYELKGTTFNGLKLFKD